MTTPLVHEFICTDPSVTRDYSDVEQLPSFISVYSLCVCYGKAHQCRKAVKLSAEYQVGVPSSVFVLIVHIYCEIVHML